MGQRTIIIGDIHGCLDEFEELLERVCFKREHDRLILVGDLINKGPNSLGVLKKAHELHCQVILGNHEDNFIRSVRNPSSNSSQSFEKLKREMAQEFEFWFEWMEGLPTFIEDETFLVVHAGLRPNYHPKETDKRILTRIRTWDGLGENLFSEDDPPWFDLYHGDKLVIFGHWASLGPMVRPTVICLDSGCVYGRQLTALILPERDIVQVDAKKVYEKITPLGPRGHPS